MTVHAITIDYDNLHSNEQSVLKLTIIQGVKIHINYNAEKFRYRNKPEAINRLVVATNEAGNRVASFQEDTVGITETYIDSIEPSDILDGSTEVLFMADTGFSLKLFTGF
ncbi:hypothetical protein RhiirA5_502921 [Rhizophagus irregularis]|uniref:Uncharacterized protein n=1 Tax=Rhizophagus irregularis TaxID=588596 RepID=A0A2N0PBN1_9GLOM|nr:hypothetical protein RhiirA5_502921 [Rhizophagus irregularis]